MTDKRLNIKYVLALLSVVILTLTILAVAILSVKKQEAEAETTTSIVGDVLELEKDKYKQSIYNETRDLTQLENIETLYKLNKSSIDSTYTEFTYYIHIGANGEGYQTYNWSIYLSNNNEDFRLEYNSENHRMFLALGEYGQGEVVNGTLTYPYEQSKVIEHLVSQYDYYIVFQKDKIVICYYDFLSTLPPQEDRINTALKFPVFTFDNTTREYNYIINHFLKENLSADCSNSSNSEFSNFIVEEHCEITIDMDLPIRKGYEFLGWYYDSACTQKYTANPVKDTTELFPKWRALAFKVIFDTRVENNPNFGEEVVKYYDYNAVIDYIPNEPEGYAFVGWYYDNGNVKYCGEPITENTVFRAEFTKCYYVTFYDQYRKPLKSQRVLENEIPEIPVHKEIGYKFVGWWNEQAMSDYNKEPITENTSLIATMLEAKCKVSLYVNNEIYKAYSVGYGLPLDKFLSENKINQIFISKYQNYDLTGAEIPISDFNIEKDMRIDISEKYITAINFENSINANKGLIATCLIAFGVLIVVWVVLYVVSKTTKPKKATKKKAK